MKTDRPILVALACVSLSGCMTSTSDYTTRDAPVRTKGDIQCTQDECAAIVTVASIGNACKPNDIATIDLSSGTPGGKKVTWTIGTPGYEFSRESYKFALFIKNDPFDELKDASVTGNGQTLTIKFNGNSAGRNFKYAITVRKSAGNKAFCETLDPWMIS